MNEFSGYAHQIAGGRWWAMLRFARDSKPKPVLGEGGAPVVFDTELEALRTVSGMSLTSAMAKVPTLR